MLDPKFDYRVPEGAKLRSKFDPHADRQVIQVEPDEYEAQRWEEAIGRIVDRGDCILYCDEVMMLTGTTHLPRELGRAVRMGRSLGVGVWSGSQRPKEIPSALFTESEHFYVFRLTFDADRDKVIAFTSDILRNDLARTRGHDYVYWNVLRESGLYVRAA